MNLDIPTEPKTKYITITLISRLYTMKFITKYIEMN